LWGAVTKCGTIPDLAKDFFQGIDSFLFSHFTISCLFVIRKDAVQASLSGSLILHANRMTHKKVRWWFAGQNAAMII
jgi:hypothetical protein